MFEYNFVGSPEDRSSQAEAHIIEASCIFYVKNFATF